MIEPFSILLKKYRSARYRSYVKKILIDTYCINVNKMEFISYNGRTVSFSFVDKSINKKYFAKIFLMPDTCSNKSVKEIVSYKCTILAELKECRLISYSPVQSNSEVFVREYIDGVNALDYLSSLSNRDFTFKSAEVINYIDRFIDYFIEKGQYVEIDLHLENISILNDGSIDMIDLDLLHNNVSKTNYKTTLYTNLIIKSIKKLEFRKANIFFNLIKQKLVKSHFLEEGLLSVFYYAPNNKRFNEFILENVDTFIGYDKSFDKSISIKRKIIDTLSCFDRESYFVSKRYDWLLSDHEYNSRDIDIFVLPEYKNSAIDIFKSHGWDVYKNIICQFFECSQLLVRIDLRVDIDKRHRMNFEKILKKSDFVNKLNIIDEHNYHLLMLDNALKYKGFIKNDYMGKLKTYLKKHPDFKKNSSKYLNTLSKSKGGFYLSKSKKYRKVVSNFIRSKRVVFLGADGSGKTTYSSVLLKNIQITDCSVIKKYTGGFYFPSGRTNLFFFRTSVIFLIAKKIKDSTFRRGNNSGVLEKRISNEKNKIRSYKVLKKTSVKTILFLLIPLFLMDIYVHNIIQRLSTYKFQIYDRYYDDILLNFTNKFVRNLLRLLLPSAKNKIYLYALPEEHFDRKRDENIETIIYMQNIYNHSDNYLLMLPTNVNPSFLNKKIISSFVN